VPRIRNLAQGTMVYWMFRVSAAAQVPGPTQHDLDNSLSDSVNWLYVDHDYQGTRYSGLSEIDTGNAANLEKICIHTFPEKEPAQTAPIAYAGVIYATTAHYTVALDGPTCKVIWQHKWEPKTKEILNTQRGAAIKYGKLVRGTGDGYLIALDLDTGKQLWAHQIAKPSQGYFLSMAPLTVGHIAVIGPAGAEWAGKGWVGGFDINDGTPIWKFNTVPDPWEPGANSWGDPVALKTGGGTTWTPMSYDPTSGLVYVPVGNPAPDFYDKNRPGANLYTNSVVALDGVSGKLAWYYQALPHDVRDYDLTHAGPIFRANLAGEPRNVMAITGKDGLLRLLDRDTHRVVYRVPFTTREHTDGPLDSIPLRICPGVLGGHEWNGSAYSPPLNALFVPATDWCSWVRAASQPPNLDQVREGKAMYLGGEPKNEPWDSASGWLTAFDASSGKQLWRYHAAKPMIGGVAVTAGGLVFTGELNGNFEAFNARNGALLYQRDVGGPIGGGVISFMAGQKQYLAVVSGYVGLYNTAAPELGGSNPTITVFALSSSRR
jgi:alcohol dehydrogenase (cytochrome c)